MRYFKPKNTTNSVEKTTNWLSLSIVCDVNTMSPAFENIAKKVITSKIINQFPIFDAPWGNGLIHILTNLYLSTYISAIFETKAIRYDEGNANPNKHR